MVNYGCEAGMADDGVLGGGVIECRIGGAGDSGGSGAGLGAGGGVVAGAGAGDSGGGGADWYGVDFDGLQ